MQSFWRALRQAMTSFCATTVQRATDQVRFNESADASDHVMTELAEGMPLIAAAGGMKVEYVIFRLLLVCEPFCGGRERGVRVKKCRQKKKKKNLCVLASTGTVVSCS